MGRGALGLGAAAFGATIAGVATIFAGTPPVSPTRVTIAADPPPDVTLPPAVAALRCARDDAACAREASYLVASMTGWVETPAVDNGKLISDCTRNARATPDGMGAWAFEACLRQRRQHRLWLPAAGFRLPKTGWFAFTWREIKGCGVAEGRCRAHGLLNLATGALVAVKQQLAPRDPAIEHALAYGFDPVAPPPEDEVRAMGPPELVSGRLPIQAARETVLLALLAPHATRRGVAIAADVPPELLPPPGATTPQPDRVASIGIARFGTDRWVWLSPEGTPWASGSTKGSGAIESLASGRLKNLAREIRGPCPKAEPVPDLDKIRAALGDGQDADAFAGLRAALNRCRAARR